MVSFAYGELLFAGDMTAAGFLCVVGERDGLDHVAWHVVGVLPVCK